MADTLSAAISIGFHGLAFAMVLYLISVGLSVTMGMMGFVNLAHGVFAMLGGYVVTSLMSRHGVPFAAALVGAALVTALASVVVERLLYRPLYGGDDAHKFGYEVAAIGRGPGGAALAKKLGAHVYIDSAATDAAAELQKRGGACAIVATAPSGKAMSSLIDGLGPNGTMMVVGATTEPIHVAPIQLITNMRRLHGWASGVPADSEDTLKFAELTGVRSMIERYPLEKAAEAYARMMSGRAEFRVVLTMER